MSYLILGTTLKDFTGTYLNISNGSRVSYSPHDPEITVWFFGGSTMFGIGERDNPTMPSEVAKLAEADGIRIRVENLGVTWQETELFEQQLTLGKEKPALAVSTMASTTIPCLRSAAISETHSLM